MDTLRALFDAYETSPAYIHIPEDAAAFRALMGRLGPSLELEELVNVHGAMSTLEGFINGYLCAQATARECVALRRLPEIVTDYGPGQMCGTCGHFVQHYRYTGGAPWYEPVGCGHCMDPEQDRKRRSPVAPFRQGCTHWQGMTTPSHVRDFRFVEAGPESGATP